MHDADFVENCPLLVHFQVILSGTSGSKCTSCTRIQSETNSSTCVADVILPRNVLIHVLLLNSCFTVLFFLFTSANKCAARFLSASPSNQLLCQNFVLWPFSMVTIVEALKRKRSVSLHGTSMPAHALDSSVHSCHNQRRRSTLLSLSRSNTPRPVGGC